MANTRSAAKNARKAQKRHQARVSVKSELRTLRKKALEAARAKKPAEEVDELTRKACVRFAKAASNKYIPRRTASRKIGRLVRTINKLKEGKAE